MLTIREPSRDIPVAHECDICVVGGSCTGVFAAVAAARLGAKVAVIEANGFFGGVATASLVSIWHSLYDTTGRQQIIAGLTHEVVDRLRAQRAATIGDPDHPSLYITLNTEALKIELDAMVAQASIRPFLHAFFVAPIVENGRITAAVIEDKSGRRAIKAACFIDATGDADVAHRAGLECYRHEAIQPPTTTAVLRGLNAIREKHPAFDLNKVVFDPKYPGALKKGFLWHAAVPYGLDETMVAGTRVPKTDSSDADQLTHAEMEGRRQVGAICEILRENFLDDSIHPLVALPAKIGLRDSRHVRCLHCLTEQEVLTGHRFDDAIANGSYRVDVHYNDTPGIIFRYLDGREVHIFEDDSKQERRWRPESAESPTFYQVPYRSLLPKAGGNLLLAGRCLDADPGAFGAARVMVNCNQMGQAAGVAAHLSLQSGVAPADVDVAKLRKTLADQGAVIL